MSLSNNATLQALYKANVGILRQKLTLFQVLQQQFGHETAQQHYQTVCHIVQASMGQHIRHSMDHMELAASMAIRCSANNSINNNNNNNANSSYEIHYDIRQRGGSDEMEMDAAEDRIRRVEQLLLEQVQITENDESTATTNTAVAAAARTTEEISAYFMLSGDSKLEFRLPSTVERELGFAAHHAIHHMAMVKIIAQETLQLPPGLLPLDFGKAPSTIVFDNTQQ